MSGSQSGSVRSKRLENPVPYLTEGGVVVFFAAAGLMTLIRGDLDPMVHYISEYASGRYGWVMQLGFLNLGVASLNLVPGFVRGTGEDRGRTVGYFLGGWGVLVLIAAIFVIDSPEEPLTSAGRIHLLASVLAFLSLFCSMLIAARWFPSSKEWDTIAASTRALAIVTPLSFVLEVTLFSTLGWIGLGQLFLFVFAGSWLLILARQARMNESS